MSKQDNRIVKVFEENPGLSLRQGAIKYQRYKGDSTEEIA